MADLVPAPESSAVRVALWRALHVLVDAPPHVLEDDVGRRLVAPEDGWRDRGDMHPQGTAPYRAAIVARARFVDDLVVDEAARGVGQYVILGAGIDTFAQRRADVAAKLRVFEVDQPAPQAWKRRRLGELGYGVPEGLRLVPVDFEAGASWWDALTAAGFDAARPAVVASLGVSMYLTKEATAATLRQVARLAPGSTLVMSFLLPLERVAATEERSGYETTQKAARAAGTPFVSFYTPDELIALARGCGFAAARHVSADDLAARYFAGRADGLRPPPDGEQLLVATV